MFSSRVLCRGGVDDQLIDPVGLQPIDFMQEGGCLDTGRPDLETGRHEFTLLGVQAVGGDFADRCAGQHLHTGRAVSGVPVG